LPCPGDYHNASDSAELEPTFRQGADTWAKHLVTSAAGRAATFGMILIVQGFQITNRNWHIRCSDRFAFYEICNKRVHKETVMNLGKVMMSNARQGAHGVRKPEASNGAMNMSRYISKSVLLLTLSLVICCGLYTLSFSVIGQGIFPFQANSSMLTGPESKVVVSRQIAEPFTKDEPRPSAASYDASASTSPAVAASNDIVDQNRDFGAAVNPSLQPSPQKICRFYDC
jgi:hypothetical protein